MTERIGRRSGRGVRLPVSVLGVIAAALALAGILGAPPSQVRGATPDLTIVTAAQYDVRPDEGRVAISVAITATNHLKDTTTRQYYFDRAYLAVMPGTSAFKISASSGSPRVVVESKLATYWLLRIEFGTRLAAGKTATFQLQMDLRDPGGSATRAVRVGSTLVSFPVWAYASSETPGSTVAVRFPANFQVAFSAGRMSGPTTEADGRRTWSSGGLADPLKFYAYVVADRPGAYAETTRTADVGGVTAVLTVRAWPDDPEWGKRVGGLFERGLPVLGAQIGLPWPWTEPLVVQEAVSRTSGGYAGLFDAQAGKVDVAYYAGSLVVLHEAAHAWFNGRLLADRWADEAFASWYALSAAAALGEKVTADRLTPELEATRIPLNAWGAVGEVPAESEDYAYAASLELARLIAERAGDGGLHSVWAAADAGEAAYQPPGGPLEQVDGPPDWRGLLDLLERPSGASFEDLWQDWVARPEDVPLLEARVGARIEYSSVLAVAGDWQLPRPIRDAMRAWQFEAATSQLQAARAVLDQRERIAQEASAVGLTPPVTLRAAFEESGGLDRAVAEADAERAAIAAVVAAVASRPAHPDLFEVTGLVGATPEADLGAARIAFGAGRLDETASAADSARLVWRSAAGLGRNRVTSAVLLLLAAVIGIALGVGRLRRRPVPSPSGMATRIKPPASRRDGTGA